MDPVRASFSSAMCLLAVACAPPPAAPPEPSRPEVTLHAVTMRSFKGSEPASLGHAQSLTYQRATADVLTLDTRIRFLGSGMEVRAPRVLSNMLTRGLDASGGVVLKGQDGALTGNTARAHFDGISMLASGQDPTQVRGPTYTLDASAFRIQVREERFDFDGPVESRLGGKK